MNISNSGLIDRFGRRITYLRVSVTDRCNLTCHYCSPHHNVQMIPRESILSFEEIAAFVHSAVTLGIHKVRLTGGEPLLRRNILFLVDMLGRMEGIKDIAMTTNGTKLKQFARSLRRAGLKRINISLDTLDPIKYRTLTGGGDIRDVLDGIKAARDAGLNPIKINTVLNPDITESDVEAIRNFCGERELIPQFIEVMNLGEEKRLTRQHSLAARPPDCRECDKLRLTCDGRLYSCLFSDQWVMIRECDSHEQAIMRAVALKAETGRDFPLDTMAEIGG